MAKDLGWYIKALPRANELSNLADYSLLPRFEKFEDDYYLFERFAENKRTDVYRAKHPSYGEDFVIARGVEDIGQRKRICKIFEPKYGELNFPTFSPQSRYIPNKEDVLNCIEKLNGKGKKPTFGSISRRMGLSTNFIKEALKSLEEDGRIEPFKSTREYGAGEKRKRRKIVGYRVVKTENPVET